MSLETSDAEIARIFASLKIVEVGYPPRLLKARRIEFRQRVAEICLGLRCPFVFDRRAQSEGNGGDHHPC